MQPLEVSYEGRSSSVPEARHAVTSALASWGRDDLGWTAALLVSELAANVALHARTAFTVRLRLLPDDALRLEVSDLSARVPRVRRFGEEATTGRGLHLVEDLSRAWGVDVHPGGKTVWVELAPASDATTDDLSSDGLPDGDVDLDGLLLAFPDLDDDTPAAGPHARAA